MKVIGITGGIGSGKSLVTKLLMERYGALVINTDQIAKDQMEPGGASYDVVVNYFGNGILSEDGSINRARLSEIVFNDKDKRLMINRLTHPIVLEAVGKELLAAKSNGSIPYAVIETALMIESGYDTTCDEVWYVYSPEVERRSRLKESRDYSDEKIDSIFASQSKDADFRKRYSKVIENTGDISYIEKQVERLLK
ncbi:MAG TPA: dephospho-CoA kinase [Mobilitalea sp.]|nr:dephospho-CoA kinase [Mobilitalea sp.]